MSNLNTDEQQVALNFAEACHEVGISTTDVRQAVYKVFPPPLVDRLSERFCEKMLADVKAARITEQCLTSEVSVLAAALFVTACAEHGLSLDDLRGMVYAQYPHHALSIAKRYQELAGKLHGG